MCSYCRWLICHRVLICANCEIQNAPSHEEGSLNSRAPPDPFCGMAKRVVFQQRVHEGTNTVNTASLVADLYVVCTDTGVPSVRVVVVH